MFYNLFYLKVAQIRFYFSCFFAIFLLFAPFNVYSNIKIGFVNTESILKDSNPGKNAQLKIELEFKKREEELRSLESELRLGINQLEKDSLVLSEKDKMNKQRDLSKIDIDLQRKRQAFQEDFNRRRNEEFSAVVLLANECIKRIAEQDNYDIIFEDAVAVSPRIDITEEIINILNG
ncbi:outer membrane protein [Candidatus Kinetoplastibacterium desouzaii TCC079E]|uniref:Outer membrane protein n=1 Tax=Candidatus Kinetoplastidibacterium desouzai TCC079E TaxID=1208919 RepID=M1LRW0_9PROT|nr:OmpH family outer membrane protein [Candidatus Kinetoplastibacterium desouzaii]AGF46881.1 outer membrane protein [Candidatus Kinetoplastibacterium desouzaii TCC079E]